MIIYGALFIPFITAFALYRYFKHKTVWWEFFIPLLASVVLCAGSKAIIEVVQVSSKEYWGSFVKQVVYYEDWNEYIHQTCTRSCCCDANGQNCSTETYDCSYVLYHPPQWKIITTTNEEVDISASVYNNIKEKFGNQQFVELNRNYYTDDGDEYYSVWPNDSITSIPVTTLHHYENRVKAADQSVFHFQKVTEADIKKFNLKNYPEINAYFNQDALIGYSGPAAHLYNRQLQYLNALLGHKKEVKCFVLVFENQPIDAAFYQEWLWSGGNMNEFVVCIGTDKQQNIKWAKCLSWTHNELLKTQVKDFIQQQKTLDLGKTISFMTKKIDTGFQRRNFKEFDYLTVDPPTWAVVLTYILTIALNIGLSIWIINNEFEEL